MIQKKKHEINFSFGEKKRKRNKPLILLQSIPQRTINHVLCHSSNRSSRTIKHNTIESNDIWMVQISKLNCLIPEIIYLILFKVQIMHSISQYQSKTLIREDAPNKNPQTMRSCSEGFPAKHLSLILLIATSVPLHFP